MFFYLFLLCISEKYETKCCSLLVLANIHNFIKRITEVQHISTSQLNLKKEYALRQCCCMWQWWKFVILLVVADYGMELASSWLYIGFTLVKHHLSLHIHWGHLQLNLTYNCTHPALPACFFSDAVLLLVLPLYSLILNLKSVSYWNLRFHA